MKNVKAGLQAPIGEGTVGKAVEIDRSAFIISSLNTAVFVHNPKDVVPFADKEVDVEGKRSLGIVDVEGLQNAFSLRIPHFNSDIRSIIKQVITGYTFHDHFRQ